MHIINNLNTKLKHNKKLNFNIYIYQIDTIKYKKFISSNQNQNQAKYSLNLKKSSNQEINLRELNPKNHLSDLSDVG